ncbi:MAG: hypothetical protein C0594_09625 [Marinilabiliales bacterium]|nr:MAG: hypothetical protein C0594_09625 [Marinilabiliales bacterium]
MDFYDSTIFTYVLLPLLIFIARICDVSIGTLRIIFISKGKKHIAPVLGFFEVLIWIIAIGKIMQGSTGIVSYIAYAAGFAAGNYIGILLEERLAVGVVILRIITQKDAANLIGAIREEGFGVTVVDAEGAKGDVKILFMTINRKNMDLVVEMINKYNPSAFYSIEDVRLVNQGVFPMKGKPRWRKGK